MHENLIFAGRVGYKNPDRYYHCFMLKFLIKTYTNYLFI